MHSGSHSVDTLLTFFLEMTFALSVWFNLDREYDFCLRWKVELILDSLYLIALIFGD